MAAQQTLLSNPCRQNFQESDMAIVSWKHIHDNRLDVIARAVQVAEHLRGKEATKDELENLMVKFIELGAVIDNSRQITIGKNVPFSYVNFNPINSAIEITADENGFCINRIE